MEQPAETVGPLDTIRAFGPPRDQVGDRSLEVGPAVRALVVVVLDELPENAVEVAFSADERPVQALGPRRPDKAFGEGVRSGERTGVRTTRAPVDLHTSSKGSTNLASRSRTMNRMARP